jgi:hypothetical protein
MFLPAATAAQFTPNVKPSLSIPRVTERPKIDGQLADATWHTAGRADNFTQYTPADKTAPPVQTAVLLAYDDVNLYLAFVAQDDPRAVRASMRDRDEMFRDDYVGILLDTFGSGAWYYELFVNPLGIQGDLRATTAFGEDDSFDLVYESMGIVTDSGYQVELAIPFNGLRFPNKPEQEWRATFWRNHPRDSRRRYSWASIDRDEACFTCQWGTLAGIRDVKPGSPTEVLPSVIGYQSGHISEDRTDFVNDNVDGDVSVGLKYSASSNLTAEGTVNPDFSQVESDAGQIDVNTPFALFYSERRPFFQEGADLFQTFLNQVYTRSINDPIFAAKGTARFGGTSIGYLGARDEHSPILIPSEERSFLVPDAGQSTSNILRFRQSLAQNSHVGAMVTDRRFDGLGSGTVMSLDGAVRFLNNYQLEGEFAASSTDEGDTPLSVDEEYDTLHVGGHTIAFDGEKYWGDRAYAGIFRNARHWNFNVQCFETSPAFRADNGFITRSNRREVNAWTGYTVWPDTKLFDQIQPNVNAGRVWNFDGERKDEWVRPEFWLSFKSQTEGYIARLWSAETFRNVYFDNIRTWEFYVQTAFSELLQGNLFVSKDQRIVRNLAVPEMGEGWSFDGSATIRPTQRLVIVPSWEYARLSRLDGGPELFRAYILRSRLNYQFTRELFLRLVIQYSDEREINDLGVVTVTDTERRLSIEPLLTYRVNAFTTFYVGSTHGYDDPDVKVEPGLKQHSRQFFFKLQYLLRV